MPAPLSIIIPAHNSAGDLPLCLESLMPGLEAGLIREVLVVDGGSNDATRRIAGSTGAAFIEAGPGRAGQLIAGAAAARGEWFLFLRASTALSRDWPERAAAHMGLRRGKAAVFRLKYRSDDRAARRQEAWLNRLARWTGLPRGEQGLLVSRALYNEVGGFPEVPLMEDWMIARAISKARLLTLDAEARSSAADYERDGWRKRAWADTVQLTRFLMGDRPEELSAS